MKVGDRVRLRDALTTAGEIDVPAGTVGTVLATDERPPWPFRVRFEGFSTGVTDGNWRLSAREIEVAR